MVDDASHKCDFFFNNAYTSQNRKSQLEVLKALLEKWSEDPKKVILVNTSLAPSFFKYNKGSASNEYSEAKSELIEFCEHLK